MAWITVVYLCWFHLVPVTEYTCMLTVYLTNSCCNHTIYMVKKSSLIILSASNITISRSLLGWSHYLAPVALGLLIMRNIAYLLRNPVVADVTQPNAGQNTLLFSMCGTILLSANSVPRPSGLSSLFSHFATHQYVHTDPLSGIWIHNPEEGNLKPNPSASGTTPCIWSLINCHTCIPNMAGNRTTWTYSPPIRF
jgi:hypothetical protein